MVTTSVEQGLRRNHNWRMLWLGQAISLVGDFVFDTTMVLWVATVIAKGRPWAPAAVGGVLIAAAIPVLVIGPIAGVYVDRWDRRRTMMAADAGRAVLIACLLVLPLLGQHLGAVAQLAILYVVVAAASCFSQFFNPSRLGVLGAIVHPDDRARASGLLQATTSIAVIAGPPLAAPLLFSFGVQWALVVNAASFVVSFLTLAAMRMPQAEERRQASGKSKFRSDFREGVQFFVRSRLLVTLCIGVVIATLGAGAINALGVFFVTGNLHVAATRLGLLLAAEGAGAVAGALLSGTVAGRLGSGRTFWAGLVACGLGLFAFSRTTTLPAAIAALVVVGVILGIINSVLTPLLLGATPPDMIGRVSAVITPIQQLAAIIAMAGASFLASTVLRTLSVDVAGIHFGPIDAIFAVGALLFVVGGLASIAPMRHADATPDDSSPAPAPPCPTVQTAADQ